MVRLMTEARTEPRAIPWGWTILIWSAIGLVDACQTVLFVHTLGQRRAWLPVFGVELASWLPWLLATPLISGLAPRHPFVRGTTFAAAGMHLAAFATIGVVAQAWYVGLQMAFNPWAYPHAPTFLDAWRTSLPYQAATFLIVYR